MDICIVYYALYMQHICTIYMGICNRTICRNMHLCDTVAYLYAIYVCRNISENMQMISAIYIQVYPLYLLF